MVSKKARLGIIGLGRMGMEHAGNIHHFIKDAELTGICSVVASELETAKEEFAPEIVTTDYRDFFSTGQLDGIAIATSSHTHCQIICEAVEAGVKNIFTEKPIGMSLEEIGRIKDTIKGYDEVLCQVGYNRRFDPNLAEAKKKVEAGFVGKPILVRIEARDPAGMEEFIVKFSPTSGGFIADMMTHDYDTARWFTGSEAEVIFGVAGVYAYEGLKGCDDFDNAAILMRFKNGTMVILAASRNSTYGYHAPIEIFGTEGAIRIGDYSYNNRNCYMNEGGINRTCSEWFYPYWQQTFRLEMEDFVRCIRTGNQPKVTLEDGCKAVEWAIKADEAVRGGKIVVL